MVRHAGSPALLCTIVALAAAFAGATRAREPEAVTLPPGVRAVWDAGRAVHETTKTRERICINGLWQWQPCVPRPQDAGHPIAGTANAVPAGGWGYFKVPGSWPGTTDYMQKDCQTVFAHPAWKDVRLGGISAAWYRREITVPAGWSGRRIALRLEYLNSYAAVSLDGVPVGEMRFPGGTLDLTAAARPGATQILTVAVTAMSHQAVRLSFADSARAKEVKSDVRRRGLCGDAWLESDPPAERIESVAITTSVRRGELGVIAEVSALGKKAGYVLRARVRHQGKAVLTFTSPSFSESDLTRGRLSFATTWRPERLWDLNTPDHTYQLELSLESHGRVKDAARPETFGFRELWIEGRDVMFNGTRLFVSAVPVDNAVMGAGPASESAALETFARLKAIGVNAVYSHNYGTEPGSHLDMAGVLRAADAAGMLVFFAQPHFGEYEWKDPEAEARNGYARDAEYFTRIAGNHPSVVLYAMSHNGCGYEEDMNPDLLGGAHPEAAPRGEWSERNAQRALRAEAIVRALDPSRLVYHHAGGDLGSMHTVNYYANFSPTQEQSDWLETWSDRGRKPLFLCEWGAPLSWDWTMYRGWYKGEREFGSGQVPWEFCHAEWNAQFVGDRAYALGEPEKRNLRWEAGQYRDGKLWHRWDYPNFVGSPKIEGWDEIVARALTDTIRCNRAWGLTAYCIWDHGAYWIPRDGVPNDRRELPVDWDRLQQPGFSADYVGEVYDRFDVAYERSDWTPTAAGRAILRNNGPRLGFIGGAPGRFTAKDHIYRPGQAVEKQFIVINNSRATETCTVAWAIGLPNSELGTQTVTLRTGEIARLPVRVELPATLPPGAYTLTASFRFGSGEAQEDSFAVQVLPPPPPAPVSRKIAIFDPEGDTTRLLAELGVAGTAVGAGDSLAAYDTLIVGRRALSPDGPAPEISRVRDGLRVVIFEQSVETLEKRFGFRATEYGLRQVFPRVPDSPLLAGLEESLLHDWSGEATLVPPRRTYTMEPMHGPMISWAGIQVSRAWRCGNRGNVATVLIEKPARGDFLPLLDGGFSDQYAPLMAYREGKGLVLFCQMDVTGRTAPEPAADRLVRNLVAYVTSGWKPVARRAPKIVTTAAGRTHLKALGVVSSASGPVLALGVDAALARTLPGPIALRHAEHIATVFSPPAADSPFAGVAPADVMNRDAGALGLVLSSATPLGDGVLAASREVTLCQLVPWEFPYETNFGRKRTFRRAAVLVNRVLANAGAVIPTPLLKRFHAPAAPVEQRWLDGFYLDRPEEWDDPYRFFRW